jgi:hypothetical protein
MVRPDLLNAYEGGTNDNTWPVYMYGSFLSHSIPNTSEEPPDRPEMTSSYSA